MPDRSHLPDPVWVEIGDENPPAKRAEIRDRDSGELVARLIAFRGIGVVRFVSEVPLERQGLSFHYEEAEQMRDGLTVALAEIDEWRREEAARVSA